MIECIVCICHDHKFGEDCNTACNVKEADRGVICDGCFMMMLRQLSEIVDDYALTENPGFPVPGTGGSGSAPLPGGTARMSWRQSLADPRGILGTWTRDWCDTYSLNGPKRHTLTDIVNWLRAHLSTAANSHPAIEEFAAEIRTLAAQGRQLAGLAESHGQRLQCPADHNDSTCGRTLHIDIDRPEDEVHCVRCDSRWTTARLMAVAQHSPDAWVDGQAAAHLEHVPYSTLKRWASPTHKDHEEEHPCTGKCQPPRIERRAGLYYLASIRAHKIATGYTAKSA